MFQLSKRLLLPNLLNGLRNASQICGHLAHRSYHLIATKPITPGSNLLQNSLKLVEFLRPTPNIFKTQLAGFKVKGSLKRRCKDCYFVMRQERLYVICKTHPRHKQMAMKAKEKKSWILTHATQSKIRPY